MHNNCTIFKTSEFIGKKWTILILVELNKGESPKRYSELKNALQGITPKIRKNCIERFGPPFAFLIEP